MKAKQSASPTVTDFKPVAVAENLSEAEIQQIVDEVVAQETKDWGTAEKAAMKAVMAVDVDETYLMKVADMSEAELMEEIKSNEKLSGLKGLALADSAGVKALKAAWLVRTAAWAGARLINSAAEGVLREIIRMSWPNLSSMFSALMAGDMPRFRTALARSFPRHQTFANVAGAAASSFCDTATFGLRQRACRSFASAARTAAYRIRRNGVRRAVLPTQADVVAFAPVEEVYQPASKWWEVSGVAAV
ncbi:MAG: hypothetical protein AAFU71_10045 [Cyanobacteria bacterium J06632_22]